MKIKKIVIENFKKFKERFELNLNEGVNILVGDNEAGKTTVLEAVNLALSGMFQGRYLGNDISQDLFNKEIREEYISSAAEGKAPVPPRILIEIYFVYEDGAEYGLLEGSKNTDRENKASGFAYEIYFDDEDHDNKDAYEKLIASKKIYGLPIEFYKVRRVSFSRKTNFSLRDIALKSTFIDSASGKTQNGSDVYISRIIRQNLENSDRVNISQAHRRMRENFGMDDGVKDVCEKIQNDASITDKEITISVELASQNAWETSLMTYVDGVAFHHIGKGEQNIIKTSLALSHKKAEESNLILLEEPENHLSHVNLNRLLKKLKDSVGEKQVIITTHSSFIANKLGLKNITFMHGQKNSSFENIQNETQEYFKRLPGYEILRLVLCKKAILVEGASDELIIQKAYIKKYGKLPIEDGIDVISVRGLSFKRFLEIAKLIEKPVSVVTDNDGDIEKNIKQKYCDYLKSDSESAIKIFYHYEISQPTLEPALLAANNLTIMNKALGKEIKTEEELLRYMAKGKADCALKIFEYENNDFNFPKYIEDAISNG